VKVEARGFVVEKFYNGVYGARLNRYVVSIVCDVEPIGVKAAISGEVPLLVFNDSEIDRSLDHAMQSRASVKVTVEVEDYEAYAQIC